MEIKDKYLSVSNCENSDIITFIDGGTYATMKDSKGEREVINFKVSNGRYELIYTPASTATKELMKAWGRETENWIGKKFQVKIIDSMSFGKPTKLIFPIPIN